MAPLGAIFACTCAAIRRWWGALPDGATLIRPTRLRTFQRQSTGYNCEVTGRKHPFAHQDLHPIRATSLQHPAFGIGHHCNLAPDTAASDAKTSARATQISLPASSPLVSPKCPTIRPPAGEPHQPITLHRASFAGGRIKSITANTAVSGVITSSTRAAPHLCRGRRFFPCTIPLTSWRRRDLRPPF